MITLYEKTATDFTGNGLCGLSPVSCVVRETAGGAYELQMQHPIDDDGKYALLTEERLIKAPVPKTVIPETVLPALFSWKTNKDTPLYAKMPQIPYNKETWDQLVDLYDDFNTSGMESEYFWQNNKTYAKDELAVYFFTGPGPENVWMIYKSKDNNNSGNNPEQDAGQYGEGRHWKTYTSFKTLYRQIHDVRDLVIQTLEEDTTLYKIANAGSNQYGAFARIKTNQNVTGLVVSSDIEIDEGHESQVVPEQTITEQVFRIYAVSGDEQSRVITVSARHISYDFMQNSLLDCVVSDAKPAEAIAEIQSSLLDIDLRGISTNIEDVFVSQDWSFKNPVSALLDPNTGLVAMTGAKLFRNNTEFYLFAPTQQNGITLTYGVNLLGVKWSRSLDGVYTRVIPRSGSNGDYIFISNGGQISNGAVQDQGKIYVESSRASQYAKPRNYVLNSKYQVGQEYKKPDGTTGKYTESQVLTNMRTEAAQMFLKDKIDQIKVTLDVNFLLLGDTEEFKQYKGLQTVSMYDTIRVRLRGGINATAQMVEYEYDSLLKRYNRVRLGSANFINQRTPGYRLVRESITIDKLAPEVVNRLYSER